MTTLLLFAATVAVLGLSSFRDWRELAVPGLQAGTLRVTNVSVVAILGRLGIALPGARAGVAADRGGAGDLAGASKAVRAPAGITLWRRGHDLRADLLVEVCADAV